MLKVDANQPIGSRNWGGKSYEYTEVAPVDGADGGKPGSNIRLGILYNPERVTLAKKRQQLATRQRNLTRDTWLKIQLGLPLMTHRLIILAKSLAVEFEFKGQPVVVIANHLKSKIRR